MPFGPAASFYFVLRHERPVHMIRFGTDGWRGVIADDFTFANLRRVVAAAARHLKRHGKIAKGVVVGYDTRFLSPEFARTTSEVLSHAGIGVKLAACVATTPMVSLMTKLEDAAAGLVITASHNPPEYNGIKFKGSFGGPATPQTMRGLQDELAVAPGEERREVSRSAALNHIDLRRPYLEQVASLINVRAIAAAGLRVLYDPMYGAGQGVLPDLLPGVREMHGVVNPTFGGHPPDPVSENLPALMNAVKSEQFDVGIATDGDADRVGAVDEQGHFVDAHRVFCLLLKYLVEQKGLRGDVIKTVSVSHMVDKQCRKYGLKLRETAVGFPHVCRAMIEHNALLGGEETGGLGIQTHIPERDGILVGLMLCEMMVVRQKPLSALVRELLEEFGPHEYRRVDLQTTERDLEASMARLLEPMSTIGGCPVLGRRDIDGHKFLVEGGWLLVRASGTEPRIRLYAEADTIDKVNALLEQPVGRLKRARQRARLKD